MLRPWIFKIDLRRDSPAAVYLQIAHALAEEIRRGRVAPGAVLPGTRQLAAMLGVNRKTAVLAYDELTAQGWLLNESRRGTFVSPKLPLATLTPRRILATGAMPTFRLSGPPAEVAPPASEARALTFDDGVPDTRLIPVAPLARAYRSAFLSAARHNRLGYGDPRGNITLRAAISEMLNQERGLATKPENLCITRGSQMAIYVAARLLVKRGDLVAVAELSYPPAREAFRAAGAEITLVALDEQGLRVDELARLCRRKRVRAVYLTPHHQYPTTVRLTPDRRLRLLALAEREHFAVVEDDYDHEFHFAHQPILPLASAAPRAVIYIGSMSKLLAPSLRIGYLAAPTQVIDRAAAELALIDRQGDPTMETAVADLMTSGELHRHTRKAVRLYAERRRQFAAALRANFGETVTFATPDGGLAFWVRFHADVDLAALDAHARRAGLGLLPSGSFGASRTLGPGLRLGFASMNGAEIEQAVRRLNAVVEKARRR